MDVVSFDLFDTLFYRKCAHPTDIFEMVGGKEFKEARIQAEKEARKQSPYEEITFYDIYALLDGSLAQKELETEEANIYLNPRVHGYYKRSQGKTIIIASDMYLPKWFIQRQLELHGIKYHELFLSSDLRVTKSTGNMFKKIVEKYPDKRIMHFDDRKDLCLIAERYGIEGAWTRKWEG